MGDGFSSSGLVGSVGKKNLGFLKLRLEEALLLPTSFRILDLGQGSVVAQRL